MSNCIARALPLAALAAAFLAATAGAAPIFSQTPPSDVEGIGSDRSSDFGGVQVADDFTLSVPATVRSITWRGSYAGGNSPAFPLSFSVLLYGNDPNGLPDTANVQSATPIRFFVAGRDHRHRDRRVRVGRLRVPRRPDAHAAGGGRDVLAERAGRHRQRHRRQLVLGHRRVEPDPRRSAQRDRQRPVRAAQRRPGLLRARRRRRARAGVDQRTSRRRADPAPPASPLNGKGDAIVFREKSLRENTASRLPANLDRVPFSSPPFLLRCRLGGGGRIKQVAQNPPPRTGGARGRSDSGVALRQVLTTPRRGGGASGRGHRGRGGPGWRARERPRRKG